MKWKWIDAIKMVLEEEGRSMTCDEITDLIIEKGYYESTSCYSGQIMNVYTNLHTSNLFKKDNYDTDRWELVNNPGTTSHSTATGKILALATIRVRDIYKCATVSFVNRVKYIYSEKGAPSFENIHGGKYAFIMNDIPIRFGEQYCYNNDDINDDAKNYLGLYRRTFGDNKREIILFEKAIKDEAKGDKEYLDNLIWKVIVHEYAHAIMDTMYNGLGELKRQDSKLYKYREESLANAFALKVLEKSLGTTIITHSGFDKIKEFVKNQSEEYRHGLNLYQRDDLLKMMEFWRGVKIIGNQGF